MVRPDEFITLGALRVPGVPPTPVLSARSSAKARSGLWQDAQLIVRSLERMGSKNRRRPSSTRDCACVGAEAAGADCGGLGTLVSTSAPRASERVLRGEMG